MSTYIQRVRAWSAARQAEAAALRAYNARPLEQKIQEYFNSLSPHERRAQYTMDELVLIFNAAPGRIGTALHRLGWERGRRWTGSTSYARYWIPAPPENQGHVYFKLS